VLIREVAAVEKKKETEGAVVEENRKNGQPEFVF
jgi:hypothetical protein